MEEIEFMLVLRASSRNCQVVTERTRRLLKPCKDREVGEVKHVTCHIYRETYICLCIHVHIHTFIIIRLIFAK